MRARGATLAGSVLSGALASACCLGPLVLTLLGVSGGAIAHRFEPLRPYLLVGAYGLLAAAFALTYLPTTADDVRARRGVRRAPRQPPRHGDALDGDGPRGTDDDFPLVRAVFLLAGVVVSGGLDGRRR